MKTTFKLSEHQIQDQIIQRLRKKGFYTQRLNAGKYALGEGKSRRFVQGVAAGTPDILAFKKFKHRIGNAVLDVPLPELIFIEVKVPGNKPTPLQKMKMEELEGFGARTMVVHSLEELQAELGE